MGTNTLETSYSNGQIIDASHINELTAAVINQFVGRNTSGVPESGKSLGTAAIPWGAMHADSLILAGSVVDTGQITSTANRIVSGATRTDSTQPQFLSVDGSVATMTVLGASTNITLSINALAVTVSSDIEKTGLTLGPSTNNTVLVNDGEIASDKYAGEPGYLYGYTSKEGYITLDTAGTEVTAKVGDIVALKGTTEIMLGTLESATKITNVMRGFFFDDANAPIEREGISDNTTLTLLNIGWVFVEDNGTTVDISYLTPVWGFTSPDSPTTGQYWFDMTNQTWKRYSGTEFEIINRMPIGIVVLDDTACIAYRSFDFTNTFSDLNNVELDILSTEIVESKSAANRVSVYGTEVIQDYNKLSWNITTDLEGVLVEAASTTYYLYLSINGENIISDERPYRRDDLKGDYHPYNSWRCVGTIFNNASSNITVAVDKLPGIKEMTLEVESVNGRFAVSSTTAAKTIDLALTRGDIFGDIDSNQLQLLEGDYTYTMPVSARGDCDFQEIDIYDVDNAVVLYRKYANAIRGAGGGSNATFMARFSLSSERLIEFRTRVTNASGTEEEIYNGLLKKLK